MELLEEKINKLTEADFAKLKPRSITPEEKLLGEILDKKGWNGLNAFCRCDMQPMMLKIKEAHADGRI